MLQFAMQMYPIPVKDPSLARPVPFTEIAAMLRSKRKMLRFWQMLESDAGPDSVAAPEEERALVTHPSTAT
jgi:hypothetical protein